MIKKLYRPVGLRELELIIENDFKKYPPRLPQQPIFYPVLNYEYAKQIATRWNLTDSNSGYSGFITEFEINEKFADKYEVKVVGSKLHQELWVPAEELEEFNNEIVGLIKVTDSFYGHEYRGPIPTVTNMKGKDAYTQFIILSKLYDSNKVDFNCEVLYHWKTIFINFNFWCQTNFDKYGIEDFKRVTVLNEICEICKSNHPDIELVGASET